MGQLCLGGSVGRHHIGHRDICAVRYVRPRRSNKRLDIAGVGGERAIEKAARSPNIVRGRSLIEPSQTLKIEVR